MNTETITAALRSAIPALTRVAGIPVTFSLPPACSGARLSARFSPDATVKQVSDARAAITVALMDEGFLADERSVLRAQGDHTAWHVRRWYGRAA